VAFDFMVLFLHFESFEKRSGAGVLPAQWPFGLTKNWQAGSLFHYFGGVFQKSQFILYLICLAIPFTRVVRSCHLINR
jgi:hypothetical protein